MPKLKTHKATAKRFKKTSTGKFLRRYSMQNHYNAKENSAKKSKKRRTHPAPAVSRRALKLLLPN